MTKFINNISQFIENQFPEHMRKQGEEITMSERAVLIDFVEAYYEWLEENYTESAMLNREMFSVDDVDTTLDEYVRYFREKYLKDFPYVAATDERFLIKNIIDLYRTKGTTRSIKLLIRLLFNKNAEVYFPASDLFRASHSVWFEPRYLEVVQNDQNFDLAGLEVTGSTSGATAFVDGVVRKRVKNVIIDVLYITDLVGEFETGDRVVSNRNRNSLTSPSVIGSLSSVSTSDTQIGGFEIGDILDVNTPRGEGGKVKVTGTLPFNRFITATVSDGGYGYTLDNLTSVNIGDRVVYGDTTGYDYENGEIITQKLETVVIGSSSYGTTESAANGEAFSVYNSSNTEIASGNIVKVDPFTTENANATLYLQMDTGTAIPVIDFTFNDDAYFLDGEAVVEGSELTISLSGSNGTFTSGDMVFQKDDDAGYATQYGVGVVVSANTTQMSLKDVFGTFVENDIIYNFNDVNATATYTGDNISYTYVGGQGIVSEVQSNTSILVLSSDTDKFQSNNMVLGNDSAAKTSIASKIVDAPDKIDVGGTLYTVDSSANAYFTGVLIGNQDGRLDIQTTTNDLVVLANVSEIHRSGVANNTLVLTDDDTGRGFTFEVDTIGDTSTALISNIKLNAVNAANVALLDLTIDGLNSSVFDITGVGISSGGTGYANGEVFTVIGGGISNNTPYIPARGYVTTDGSGVITSTTIIEQGEKYISQDYAVSVDTVSGSGATFTVTTENIYGLDPNLNGTSNSTIAEAFGFSSVTIGEITALKNVKTDINYSVEPSIEIENESLSVLSIYDIDLTVTGNFKSYKVGEVVTQNTTGARGTVRSYNSSLKTITVRRRSFGAEFREGFDVVGEDTTATGTVTSVINRTSDPVMGDNDVIGYSISSAEGIIGSLKIIDSGFGYVDLDDATISSDKGTLAASVSVEKGGKGQGYWRTFDSHIDYDKKIHDNYYYQEYSYDIKTTVPLDKYRRQIKDILHVAGTELFGSVSIEAEIDVGLTATSSITSS